MRMFGALVSVAALTIGTAAHAGPNIPYYGPMRGGLFAQQAGYKHKILKDGSWRISAAAVRGTMAIDIAMYRAAELAREQGYAYVQFLSAWGSRDMAGNESADVTARPSNSAAAPEGCGKHGCYTADAREVLRLLSGDDGNQPGVPVMHHRDQFGRSVYISGFGIGAASSLPKRQAPPARTAAPRATAAVPPAIGAARAESDARYNAARDALAPTRAGNGWSVSD